jgi:FkbM family methyltransferase
MIFVKKYFPNLSSFKNTIPAIKFLFSLQNANHRNLLPLVIKSKSQNYQDLFVLSELNMKQDGFFVEFGATNGVDISNTFLLEEEFGWKGILAEPAQFWQEELRRNRPSAFLEYLCVWTDSNIQLLFNETENTDLSTLNSFSSLDSHKELRKIGKKYYVNTISLTDLLDKYSAPAHIDYLSIDTEGSEFDILKSFDFDRYSFGVITCEHNYTATREKIYKLLVSKGYTRKYENISRWDDWYVKI